MLKMDEISLQLDAATPTQSSLPVQTVAGLPPTDIELKLKKFKDDMATNVALDYSDARANIRNLIASAMHVLPDVILSVEETRADKSIQAMSGFLKTVVEMNEKLVSLSNGAVKQEKNAAKEQQESLSNEQKTDANVTNNYLLVGKPIDIYSQNTVSLNERFGLDKVEVIDG